MANNHTKIETPRELSLWRVPAGQFVSENEKQIKRKLVTRLESYILQDASTKAVCDSGCLFGVKAPFSFQFKLYFTYTAPIQKAKNTLM